MSDDIQIVGFEAFEETVLLILRPPFVSSFGARWFHEIGGRQPKRDWLVKDLVLARSFGIIYGPPGSGKSFLIADMMLSAAALGIAGQQETWFGHKLRRFGVVYVVSEGAEDFEIRLHAWRAENGIPKDVVLPFVFLPTAIDMRSSNVDTAKLIVEVNSLSAQMIEKTGVAVGAIVIDTVARALAGGAENASETMSAFVRNCGMLQDQTGVAVFGVHHGGKEPGRGPRGHEALHGAADFEIEVMKPDDDHPKHRWVVRKLKAGPGGAIHTFALKGMTVSQDDDGDPIMSCVVLDTEAEERGKRVAEPKAKPFGIKLNAGEIEFLQAFGTALEKHGISPTDPAIPSNVYLVAALDHVRERYVDRLKATETGDERQVTNRLRQRWSRATRALVRYGVIGSNKSYIWMTGKSVIGATVKGAKEWRAPLDQASAPPSELDDTASEDATPLL